MRHRPILALAVLLSALTAHEAAALTYEQFVAQFQTRALAALQTEATTLRGAGASQVTVIEDDSTNLRFKLTAQKGNRTLLVYFELTPVGIVDGQMTLIVTLYVEGNGSEISHSYVTGAPLRYISDIDALLTKLDDAELTMGEVTVKSLAFLGV
jgi:hypothetical protein